MSERYNVQASTILGENYKITNIECSDYNPTIDDNITVTITVTDVYEDPIEGENVTVTATGGTFTQLNGSSITAAATVTGTTNSSGQFTLTYTCTEWGLITFTANNKSTQIRVNGWRSVNIGTYGTLLVNGEERLCEFSYYRTNFNLSSTTTTIETNLIPSAYRKGVAVTLFNSSMGGNLDDNGTFSVHTTSTGTGKTINAHAIWSY